MRDSIGNSWYNFMRCGVLASMLEIQKFHRLGACLGISIQVTSMDDQSVQLASIRPQCLFAPIPAA